jgi:hypothetical protein
MRAASQAIARNRQFADSTRSPDILGPIIESQIVSARQKKSDAERDTVFAQRRSAVVLKAGI